MSEQNVKPYNLSEYLRMPPGALLGGLVDTTAGKKPAHAWGVKTPPRGRFVLHVYQEYDVRWRQEFRGYSHLVKGIRVYRPPQEYIDQYKEKITMFSVRVNTPIGLYLGHILRMNGVSLVNILTGDGYDVWV